MEAPNRPWATRNSTISVSEVEMPHRNEVMVKPTMLKRYMRLRPKRPASQPVGGVMMAAPTM